MNEVLFAHFCKIGMVCLLVRCKPSDANFCRCKKSTHNNHFPMKKFQLHTWIGKPCRIENDLELKLLNDHTIQAHNSYQTYKFGNEKFMLCVQNKMIFEKSRWRAIMLSLCMWHTMKWIWKKKKWKRKEQRKYRYC